MRIDPIATGGAEAVFIGTIPGAADELANTESADSEQPETPEIVDPLTGELIAADDLDALIDLYERCKREADRIYVAKTLAAKALVLATTGEAKTRRLVTKAGRRIKVELPSNNWNNATLKRCWAAFPDLREQYLRIATIEPQLREVNKLRETTSEDSQLAAFKQLVLSAEQPPTAMPKILVES